MSRNGARSILGVILNFCVAAYLWAPQHTYAVEAPAADDCRGLLERFHSGGAAAGQGVDASSRAAAERYTLSEFFAPNAEGHSFASLRPVVAMSVAQRYLYEIKSQGMRTVRDPMTGNGTITQYMALSDGLAVTGGRKLVGHPRVGETLVGLLELQADGFKTGLKVPLAIGNPGSGKSEGFETILALDGNLTLSDERFHKYTFEFTNLDAIPELARLYLPDEHTGKIPNKRDALNDSPLVLLPEPYREAVMNQISPEVMRAIGRMPRPKRSMCPPTRFIRQTILDHYRLSENGGVALTADQEMQYLARHVQVVRDIGGANGRSVKINFQGRNVDLGVLMMQPNMGLAAELPPTHPLAMQYGQIVAASGGIVFFDEMLKNSEEFQHALLDTIQARSYSLHGAEPVEFDIVFMAASNTDDYIKVMEKAKTHTPPIIDRGVVMMMNWSIRPHEIMRILAYEAPKLQMVPLGDANATAVPVRRGNLETFIVSPEDPAQPWSGPDGRYRSFVGEDAGGPTDGAVAEVDISPHSLLFMSRVVALSRMSFDDKALARAFAEYGITSDHVPAPLYRDFVERLNLLEGRGNPSADQLMEFWNLSGRLREGSFGISSREASEWLGAAIIEARKPGYGNSVTPLLLRQILETKRFGGSEVERTKISNIATAVAQRLTIPALKLDLMAAMVGADGTDLEHTYDQVFEDLTQEGLNGSGRGRWNPGARLVERLARVKEIYRRLNGQDLDIREVRMQSHFNDRAGGNQVQRRYEPLLNAVTEYLVEARLASMDTRIDRIVQSLDEGSGRTRPTDAESSIIQGVLDYLRLHKGYSAAAAAQAIQMVRASPATQPAPATP